jgi:hypothetical protein
MKSRRSYDNHDPVKIRLIGRHLSTTFAAISCLVESDSACASMLEAISTNRTSLVPSEGTYIDAD